MPRVPLLPLCAALVACQPDYALEHEHKVLSVTPAIVDLDVIAVGTSVEFGVMLTHDQGPNITVTELTVETLDGSGEDPAGEDALFQGPTELPVVPVDGESELRFTYAPTSEGYHLARITIVTNEDVDPVHTVTVRAQAVNGVLQVLPQLVDFGPVPAGTTLTAPMAVINLGALGLTVDAITFDDPHFGLAAVDANALPAPLVQDTAHTFTLQFSPTDDAEVSGWCTVNVSPATSPVSILVRGNACATGSAELYDSDSDGFSACGQDCDDRAALTYPGAEEICDDADNDCDGTVDETTECYDDDGDGYTENEGDCNDGDDDRSPGEVEDYDNYMDDDCDGVVDNYAVDVDADGYSPAAGDCDDAEETVHEGAPELADGLDNDCDGTADEGTDAYDDDGDGETELDGDCDDTEAATGTGATETADWADNDCDGTVDEGTDHFDDDGDGFTETGGDCDDADATINPGSYDYTGDGIDNDCDGTAA